MTLTTHQAVVLTHLTKPNHAYAVAQEINAAGTHVIGIETCYRTVAALEKAGFIGLFPNTNPPRYEMTHEGWLALNDFAEQQRKLIKYIEQTYWMQQEAKYD
jgi:DNA-binding PadR family transcriptional regulator